MEKIKQYLKSFENPRILDVGSGVGNFVYLLKSLDVPFKEIIGIDIMKRLVDIANKNFEEAENILFFEMDVLNMDFPDESFDVITFSNSLHHVRHIKEIFNEIRRVLKKGGLLIVNEMVSNNLNDAQISHRLIHHFAAKIDRHAGLIHDDTFTNDEIISVCQSLDHFNLVDYWNLQMNEEVKKEDGIEGLIQTVDQLMNRIHDNDFKIALLEESISLKAYIKKFGVLPATQLLLVLQK